MSVYIDFEDFGIFSSAKDMVKKYELNSCHDHLIEQHAGKNELLNYYQATKLQDFGLYPIVLLIR